MIKAVVDTLPIDLSNENNFEVEEAHTNDEGTLLKEMVLGQRAEERDNSLRSLEVKDGQILARTV